MQRPRSASALPGILFAALVLLGASPVLSADESEIVRPAVLSDSAPFGADRPSALPAGTLPATALARRWLSSPRCREVFTDFRDSSGRTLQQILDARGETPESYVSRIAFVQGSEAGRCGESGVLAMTSPGNPFVWLCGGKVAALARRDLRAVAVVILHEELHSLGLGEDPPTSQEISRRVETSCR